MKTKDLNFIEAYEAFKAGHDVYLHLNDREMKIKAYFDLDNNFTLKEIFEKRFFIKAKPLRVEFNHIIKKGPMYLGAIDEIIRSDLSPAIGKMCKITVEEIVE